MILVIDDDLLTLRVSAFVLQQAGYHVHTAATGAEGLAAVSALRPALVLMDVELPDADGFELTRRLRADPATAGLLIVAHTALEARTGLPLARAAGCDGYLGKPVDARSLVAAVDAYLSPPAVSAAPR